MYVNVKWKFSEWFLKPLISAFVTSSCLMYTREKKSYWTTGKSIVINGGSERKNGRKIMCKLAAVVINVLCPPIK